MQRLFLFFVMTLFLHSSFAQDEQLQALLKQADRLMKEKKYDEALFNIESVLKVDPLYFEALEKKVSAMVLSDKSKELSDQIERSIKVSPQQPEYHYMRGLLNLVRGKSLKAVEDFDNAIYYQLPEKYNDKLYLNRGKAFYAAGNLDKAEKDYIDALALNARSSAIYHNYGILKYEQGQYEEATSYFLKAFEFENDNPLILYNLAMSYFRSNDMGNACYYFNRSCSLGYRNACKVYLLECSIK